MVYRIHAAPSDAVARIEHAIGERSAFAEVGQLNGYLDVGHVLTLWRLRLAPWARHPDLALRAVDDRLVAELLDGCRVLVTGATSRLGAAMSAALAGAGARAMATGSRPRAPKRPPRKLGTSAIPCQLDVRDERSVAVRALSRPGTWWVASTCWSTTRGSACAPSTRASCRSRSRSGGRAGGFRRRHRDQGRRLLPDGP